MQQSEVSEQVRFQVVDTSISAITVYVNQALVTRRGLLKLTGQELELRVLGLPASLQPESVQVSGIGTVAVRLFGARSERMQTSELPSKQTIDLTQQVEQLQEQQRNTHNRLGSLGLQRDFVQGLSRKSIDYFSEGLVQRQVDLDETRQLIQFLGEIYSQYTDVITQTEKDQQEFESQIQLLRQRLQQQEDLHAQGGYNVTIPIEPTGAGEFVLEITYIVEQANWIPVYDLAVNRTGNKVSLSYGAEIRQNTGENWVGATLRLSTSELGIGAPLPKLYPWYIDSPDSEAKSQSLSEVESTQIGMIGDLIQAQGMVTKVARESGVFTLELGQKEIASDNTARKITILSKNYPCHIEHIAVPRLSRFAYVQANVSNDANGVTLLSGKANIFRNHLFIGTIQLENITPGQEFKLNLGIDEGVTVDRTLIEQRQQQRWLTQRQLTTYRCQLKITNSRDQEVHLNLVEQLPVSRDRRIKVRLVQTFPRILLKEMKENLLEWRLALPARATRELNYQFILEYPVELVVKGLNANVIN